MKSNIAGLLFGAGFGFVVAWAHLSHSDVIRDMLMLREAHVLLMLSRLLWASGRQSEAIRVAEEAELILEPSPILKRYRERIAPQLVSCSSLDAAIDDADRIQTDEERSWRYRVPDEMQHGAWRDPGFDDSQWRRGVGNLGWLGFGPSNRLVLRQRFVLQRIA